jgi:hypothetical protein
MLAVSPGAAIRRNVCGNVQKHTTSNLDHRNVLNTPTVEGIVSRDDPFH